VEFGSEEIEDLAMLLIVNFVITKGLFLVFNILVQVGKERRTYECLDKLQKLWNMEK